MSDKDFKPGIHSVSYERYRAAAGVSKSMLDILAEKTPAHLQAYLRAEPEETPALRFGTILHRALLEPDTYREGFHVKPEKMNFATKDGKAWRDEHEDRPLISFDEEKQITAMVSAIYTHPFAKRLLTGAVTEQSIFVEDAEGVLRKSRLDALTKGSTIPDIKTTESANMEMFERSISRYRLHVQAAYYVDNCRLAGIEKNEFFFIAVEKSPPYAVRCLQLMPEVLSWGRFLYRNDLQTYRNCVETNFWPCWSDGYEDVTLPTWEMKQLENAPL